MQVQGRLHERVQSHDGGAAAALARQAAWRWLNWPLSQAFSSWQANAVEQAVERSQEHRATHFLYYALTLKVL